MKFLITIIFIFIFNINYALSDSLYDALKITYKNNKELNAERENVNIAKQDLKISKGNYLPTGTITGSKSQQDTNKLTNQSGGDTSTNDVDPVNTTINGSAGINAHKAIMLKYKICSIGCIDIPDQGPVLIFLWCN